MTYILISKCWIGKLRDDLDSFDEKTFEEIAFMPREYFQEAGDELEVPEIWVDHNGEITTEPLICFQVLLVNEETISIWSKSEVSEQTLLNLEHLNEDNEELILKWIEERLKEAGITSDSVGEEVWSDVRYMPLSANEDAQSFDSDYVCDFSVQFDSDIMDISSNPEEASGKLIALCQSCYCDSMEISMTESGIAGKDGWEFGDYYDSNKSQARTLMMILLGARI
ncbi:hypothetical protein H8D29_00620 [PVC group bacterium]|nr:hypothetical protein [PVC group bacterium]